MRAQVLLMALVIAPLAVRGASGVSIGGAPLARASLDVSIVVPTVMQLHELARPASIDITAEDVARGKLTVTGSLLDLLVNSRGGYLIRARVVNAVVTAVSVIGLPGPLVATPDSATLPMASMVGRPKPAPLPVQYELQLSPGVQPGHYAWPVALTLEAP
ncbi:MAG TPA: hypothetical protein VKR38_17280 [Usitatibacter sp.]|nr:hypothetical protein [Usitatibacter sp.]